jgi:tetraacyldisaccharide 4'-kinase
VDDAGTSDEVGLLRERCPSAEVVVDPNKVAGARRAAAHGADLILLDDGFQHRRLHRDLDVVVVDGRHPFGNGDVLPAGSLREPSAGLGRADVVVVTHHDELDEDQREALEGRLHAHKLGLSIVYGLHVPVGVRPLKGGGVRAVDSILGRELFLFCGIASPDGFRHTVEALGGDVVGVYAFPDHHHFRPADMAKVRAAARTAQLLCTEKDAAKVARIPGHDDVLCLVVELQLEGELPRLPRPEDLARPAADAHGH